MRAERARDDGLQDEFRKWWTAREKIQHAGDDTAGKRGVELQLGNNQMESTHPDVDGKSLPDTKRWHGVKMQAEMDHRVNPVTEPYGRGKPTDAVRKPHKIEDDRPQQKLKGNHRVNFAPRLPEKR